MSDDTIERVTELMIAGFLAQDEKTHDHCLGKATGLLTATDDAHAAMILTLVGMARYAAFVTAMVARENQTDPLNVVGTVQQAIRDGETQAEDGR